jgi:hypothetical protein
MSSGMSSGSLLEPRILDLRIEVTDRRKPCITPCIFGSALLRALVTNADEDLGEAERLAA